MCCVPLKNQNGILIVLSRINLCILINPKCLDCPIHSENFPWVLLALRLFPYIFYTFIVVLTLRWPVVFAVVSSIFSLYTIIHNYIEKYCWICKLILYLMNSLNSLVSCNSSLGKWSYCLQIVTVLILLKVSIPRQ